MRSRSLGAFPPWYTRSVPSSPFWVGPTGLIHAPNFCPSHSRPATQRPLSLRELARHTSAFVYGISRLHTDGGYAKSYILEPCGCKRKRSATIYSPTHFRVHRNR